MFVTAPVDSCASTSAPTSPPSSTSQRGIAFDTRRFHRETLKRNPGATLIAIAILASLPVHSMSRLPAPRANLGEYPESATRFADRADRALSRRTARPGADGHDLSAGSQRPQRPGRRRTRTARATTRSEPSPQNRGTRACNRWWRFHRCFPPRWRRSPTGSRNSATRFSRSRTT